MSIEEAAALLTAIGIGGIFGAFFKSLFEQRGQIKEHEHELKRRRYGAILILMITVLDPENGLQKLKDGNIRPDIKTLDDVKHEMETELLNSFLFASDDVIRALSEFIKQASYSTYAQTALAMRRDLWGNKTKIDADVFSPIIQKRENIPA